MGAARRINWSIIVSCARIERRRALMHPVVSLWVSCQGVSRAQVFFLFPPMFPLDLGRWTIFQPNV